MIETFVEYLKYSVIVGFVAFVLKYLFYPFLDFLNSWLNRNNGFLGNTYGRLLLLGGKLLSVIDKKNNSTLDAYNEGYEYRIMLTDNDKLLIRPSRIRRLTKGGYNRIDGQIERKLGTGKEISSISGKLVLGQDILKYIKWDEYYIVNKKHKVYTTAYYELVKSNNKDCNFIGVSIDFFDGKVNKYISVLCFGDAFEYSENMENDNPVLRKYLKDFNIDNELFRNYGRINYS